MNCGDFLIYQNAVKSRFTQGLNWTNRGTFRLKFLVQQISSYFFIYQHFTLEKVENFTYLCVYLQSYHSLIPLHSLA